MLSKAQLTSGENSNGTPELAVSKENINDQPYKAKYEGGDSKNSEEVLMTVTNSINTEGMQSQLGLTRTSPSNKTADTLGAANFGSTAGSAKKENDKKIWKKRI